MKLWRKVLIVILFLLAVPFMVVAGILIVAISKITHGFNEEVSMKIVLLILAVSLGGCVTLTEEQILKNEEARFDRKLLEDQVEWMCHPEEEITVCHPWSTLRPPIPSECHCVGRYSSFQ